MIPFYIVKVDILLKLRQHAGALLSDYRGTEGDDKINADVLKITPWATID